MRGNAAVDGIGEGDVTLFESFVERGGVNASGGAKGVAADDGIVWRNCGVRGGGDGVAIFLEAAEVAVDETHEREIDEHEFHRRVSDAFAESVGGAVNGIGTSS